MIKQSKSLVHSLSWLWLMFSAAVITEALTAQQWHQCNGATRLQIMTLSKDWITQLWHSFKLTQGKLQAVGTVTPWLFRRELTLKNYCCMIWPGGIFLMRKDTFLQLFNKYLIIVGKDTSMPELLNNCEYDMTSNILLTHAPQSHTQRHTHSQNWSGLLCHD